VVNSFWLSGCGRAQAVDGAAEPSVDASLRAPLLAGDWAAWAEAWQRLDAEAIPRADRAEATLTLCGERSAARFEARPQGLLGRLRRRWQADEAHAVLEGL
jgi:urease accessory protein UreF